MAHSRTPQLHNRCHWQSRPFNTNAIHSWQKKVWGQMCFIMAWRSLNRNLSIFLKQPVFIQSLYFGLSIRRDVSYRNLEQCFGPKLIHHLIKRILQQVQILKSAALEWGEAHEFQARKEYTSAVENKHTSFKVEMIGLHMSPQLPSPWCITWWASCLCLLWQWSAWDKMYSKVNVDPTRLILGWFEADWEWLEAL